MIRFCLYVFIILGGCCCCSCIPTAGITFFNETGDDVSIVIEQQNGYEIMSGTVVLNASTVEVLVPQEATLILQLKSAHGEEYQYIVTVPTDNLLHIKLFLKLNQDMNIYMTASHGDIGNSVLRPVQP